jgi:peptidoglycan/xylan/chitin deacetylase (PgdA/CDA1 family)
VTPTSTERRRARLRRRRRRLALLVAVLALAVVIVVVVPWFGHLGVPWPDGASGIRVVGADAAWHDRPVTLSFRTAAGTPVAAQWRIVGQAWHKSSHARVGAPLDHRNDGEHVVDVRALGGGDTTTVRVRIDTLPPEVGDVRVTPDTISGPTSVRGTFDLPESDAGFRVEWAVVDVLGDKLAGGRVQPTGGRREVTWSAGSGDGGMPPPGTYWLSVTVTDSAGNRGEARSAVRCEYPVKAKVLSSLPAAGRLVALTFDGGSGYAWRNIMNTLHRNGVTGSFFCTGVSVDKYPEMARLAIEQGHTIGNHSIDHPDFSGISHAEAVRQLKGNADAWWRAARATPAPFFRPPYGSYTDDTLRAAGETGYLYVTMWDVDTGDWTGLSPQEIARNAVADARPGSIIVMHTQWNSAKAIQQILDGLKKKGLKPVNLAEMVAAAGLR